MKTKYDVMLLSEVTDSNGNNYADLATFPIEDFTPTTKPIEYKLTYNDTERFFDIIYTFYNEFEFYDDIILWLNDIIHISDSDENFQKIIRMYSKSDVDRWYRDKLRAD